MILELFGWAGLRSQFWLTALSECLSTGPWWFVVGSSSVVIGWILANVVKNDRDLLRLCGRVKIFDLLCVRGALMVYNTLRVE